MHYQLITIIFFLICQKTHFALAFEVPGGWRNEKEAMTLTVLQVLDSYFRFLSSYGESMCLK